MKLVKKTIVFSAIVLLTAGLMGCMTGESNDNSEQVPEHVADESIENVGFDFDDTLVFSTPAFNKGWDSDAEPFSEEFWKIVNQSDAGNSCPKPAVIDLLEQHRERGRDVYIITARNGTNGQHVREFVEQQLGISGDRFYFEPDTKVDRIEKLDLDVYYGDSDSDIKEAQQAGVRGIRIQRNEDSGYEDKFHPGKYDELVVDGTAGHRCK